MGIGRALRRMVAGTPRAQRGRISASALTLDDYVIERGLANVSGEPVSRRDALSVPAMLRGRNIVCSLSTLPLVQTNGPGSVQRNPLLDQIDPDVPNVVTVAQTIEDLMFESIAWWQVTAWTVRPDGGRGFPIHAKHLNTWQVTLSPINRPNYDSLPSNVDPRGIPYVYVDGVQTPATDVIRFDSPNPPLRFNGARTIRRALLLDRAAGIYANDPRAAEYFTPADNAEDLDDDEIKDFLNEWQAARRKRTAAWVPSDRVYHSVDTPNAQQMGLSDLQARAALDIANMVGVDPEELGVSTTSRTYSNVNDRRQDKVNEVLSPYALAITQRLSMGDVTPRGHRVAFDFSGYLVVNPTDRASIDGEYIDRKVITRDEARANIGLAPLTDAQRAELEPAPPPPPPVDPSTVDPSTDTGALSNSMDIDEELREMTSQRARFSAGDERSVRFSVPTRGFTVDSKRRTIEGIALPYGPGAVAEKYGFRFRFLQGSLQWGSANRVKMDLNHQDGTEIGYAMDLTDMAVGLRTKFKLDRSPEATVALQKAEDGVWDGLSVDVTFDWSDVVMGDDEVANITKANLHKVALTATPAFTDARVTSVTASKTQRGQSTMDECTTCGQRHAPGVACASTPPAPNSAPANQPANQPAESTGLQLTAEARARLLENPGLVDAMFGQMLNPQPQPRQEPARVNLSADQMRALMAQPRGSEIVAAVLGVQLQPEQVEAPAVVNPNRPVPGATGTERATATVNEPSPYRFNRRGQLVAGTHEFSADLIAWDKSGDKAAYDRALTFIRSQFADDPIATADVNDLFPTQYINRYVDERPFAYPLYTRLGRGAPPNGIQPFAWPKFSASGIVVADHVQGTDPDSKDYQTDVQTVTPAARSGRVQIPREIWDVGGTPALSQLIWAKAMRAWGEKREAVIDAVLDAETPTSLGTFTAGGGTGKITLTQEMEGYLAALNFARGGFRFDFTATQVDLFKDLGAAVDSTGRKIYPMMAPENANGLTASRWNSMNIGGVEFVPNIAGDATSGNASSSYLLDSTAVDAWDSGPLRIDMATKSLSYVEIGIWGYIAAAVNDLAGVREISYDPVA